MAARTVAHGHAATGGAGFARAPIVLKGFEKVRARRVAEGEGVRVQSGERGSCNSTEHLAGRVGRKRYTRAARELVAAARVEAARLPLRDARRPEGHGRGRARTHQVFG